MSSHHHITSTRVRTAVRGSAIILLCAACAAPAPPATTPNDPQLGPTPADANLPAAPADANLATAPHDTTPEPANLPAARGTVFVKSDGTCWQQEQITCATNTDCQLPPHRQVTCPSAGD